MSVNLIKQRQLPSKMDTVANWNRQYRTHALEAVREYTTDNQVFSAVSFEIGDRLRAVRWQRHQQMLRIMRRRSPLEPIPMAEIEALLSPIGF